MKQLLSFLIVCLFPMLCFSQIVVEQSIDTMQIKIGEQTTFRLSVYVGNGQKVIFPDFSKNGYIVPNLEVLDSSVDTIKQDDEKLKITKSYLLTSFDSKLYTIPSQEVNVDGKKILTDVLALKVLDVAVDTAHVDKFFPPKGVQSNPFDLNEWIPTFIFSLAFTLSLLLLLYIVSRRKSGKPVIEKFSLVKFIPAHQKALGGIKKLKEQQFDILENPKDYYTQLTLILRRYIEQRFGFDAMEMTSSEIVERLKSESHTAIEDLSTLFATADLVKFAKHSIQVSDNDRNLLTALQFIEDTKSDEKERVEVVRKNATSNESRSSYFRRTLLIVFLIVSVIVSFVLWCHSIYTLM